MEGKKLKYLKVFITAVFLLLIIPLNVSLFGKTISNIKTVSAMVPLGPTLSGAGIAEHTTGSVILAYENPTGRVYKTDMVFNKWNYTDVTVASQPPMPPIWASISSVNVPEDGTQTTVSYDTATGTMYVIGIKDLKTNLDTSDFEVVFSVKPQQGMSVIQYSIMVVPESQAASFDIVKASTTTGQSCTVIPSSGASSYVQKLSNTSRDVNGNLIKLGVSYKVFVQTTFSMGSGYMSILSPASSSITLHSNKLSGLYSGDGTLSPSFNPDTTSYTLSVPNKWAYLTSTAVDSTATIKINGTQSDTVGFEGNRRPQITVSVSAPGIPTKEYTINVTLSSNNLKALAVAAAPGSNDYVQMSNFDSDTTEYTVSVNDGANDILLSASREDVVSHIEVYNGEEVVVEDGERDLKDYPVRLQPGANTIIIKVTPAIGGSKTYTLTIVRVSQGTSNAIQTALSQGTGSVAINTSGTQTSISATDFSAILNSGLGITTGFGHSTLEFPPTALQNIAAQAPGCAIAITSIVTTNAQDLKAMSLGKPEGVYPIEAAQVSLTGINAATGGKTDIHNVGDKATGSEATLIFTGVTQAIQESGVLTKQGTGVIDGKALTVWYDPENKLELERVGGIYDPITDTVKTKRGHFSTYVLAYSTATQDTGSSDDDKDSSSSSGTSSQTGTTISSGTVSGNSVKVAGITIDKSERTISEGNTVQLNINIVPSNAVNKAVKWTSSDEKIATVDNSGKVMAIAQGKVVITATSADGNFSASCNLTVTERLLPEIKFVGLGHSPLVEGDKEDFIISSGYDGNVQYRIYLNVDGSWQEVTNGYSAAVSGKDTFTITPDYAFQKGQYQGRVYVKKVGTTGSKQENGIDFDNYYTYNINCVDRDDANRVYTAGNLNIINAQATNSSSATKAATEVDSFKAGQKVTITRIDGISGIPGPYYYRLSIYDVANDKWTNNVVPYSEMIEWTPNAVGTYVLDIHVITPNSVLWNNVQNDPTLIYGGYEGWKLKTVKVNN